MTMKIVLLEIINNSFDDRFMEHVSFSFQILPIVIGLSGFIILLLLKERIPRSSLLRDLWLSGLVFFGLYFLLMTSSTASSVYHWNTYESGVFETIEQKQVAMKRVVNDTGVQFAFIISAIFSMFIAFFVWLIRSIINYINAKNSNRTENNLTRKV